MRHNRAGRLALMVISALSFATLSVACGSASSIGSGSPGVGSGA